MIPVGTKGRHRTKFHDGGARSWELAPNILARLSQYVARDSATLETGAGQSTVFFAKAGCHHLAITPAGDEIERIKSYCGSSGISLENVEFINASSQDALPGLKREIDFFLIDGGHGFPIPQIDWFYGSRLLKVGGVLAIDDVHTWTGAILKSFLEQDTSWQSLGCVDYKTAFFKLTKPFQYEEWDKQPFVLSRSKRLILNRKLRRLPGRISRGDWTGLYQSFRRSLRF